MFNLILLIVVLAIVGFAAVAAMQSDDMRVARSATLSATPADVFAEINDLSKWNAWSPWARLDPNAKTTFEGPASGVGSKMSWDSDNGRVGAGSMTITESRPSEYIKIQLDFLKPMKGTSTAEFTLKPADNQTEVTWSMVGKRNFIGKAMGLIINCEKMVGGMFEQGLGNLKEIVEKK